MSLHCSDLLDDHYELHAPSLAPQTSPKGRKLKEKDHAYECQSLPHNWQGSEPNVNVGPFVKND